MCLINSTANRYQEIERDRSTQNSEIFIEMQHVSTHTGNICYNLNSMHTYTYTTYIRKCLLISTAI